MTKYITTAHIYYTIFIVVQMFQDNANTKTICGLGIWLAGALVMHFLLGSPN